MKIGRIVCVGNQLVDADAAGIRVFQELQAKPFDHRIEIIEGALGGIDLLQWFEHCRRVVLVDSVVGFGVPGTIVHLDLATVCSNSGEEIYSHSGGLLYLLRALPFLGLQPMPAVSMVGIEGQGHSDAFKRAAELAMEIIYEET